MRDAFYRLTSPILDRIPDITHRPKTWQVSVGLAASLLFHLLLLLLALGVGVILPGHSMLNFAKPKPMLEEIELTIIPPAPTEEMRLVPLEEMKAPQFLDSAGLATVANAPDKAIFQSDRNMAAASEIPALGDLPMPSQLGRVEPEFPMFESQPMSLGSTATPFAPRSSPSTPESTTPPPDVTPPSPPSEAPRAAKVVPPSKMKEVEKPAEDEVAIAARAASPPEVPPPKVRMRTTVPVALQSAPPPEPAPESAPKPHREKTRVEGAISNRGPNSVDAGETPLGRYMSVVERAVSSRWGFYVVDGARGARFPAGTVRVSFTINRNGKVRNVRSEGNTSTPAYGFTSESAVIDSQFPPLPPEVIDVLPDGELEITYTLRVYSL